MSIRPTLLLLAPLLTGCASLPNKGNSSFLLNSVPPSATVLVNGSERGVTPFTCNYHPDDGSVVSLERRWTGYRSSTLNLRPATANGVLFVDAMLLHIPYLFDRRNPDRYRVPVRVHTVQLHKELPAHRTRDLMPVTGLEVGIGERTALAILGGKAFRNDRNNPLRALQYPDQLTGPVSDALRRGWMGALAVGSGG